MILFSPSARAFYHAQRSRNIPADAVPVTDAEHAALMAGQAAGQRIIADTDGRPTLAAPETQAPTHDDVDAERRRRVRAGFTFAGVFYQSDAEAMENIAGAATSAIGAQRRGHGPGDLRWFRADTDFVWIAADNSMNPMDAPTMEAFGNAAMAHVSAHIFAARAIKAMTPIPADFTDPAYWP